MREETSFDEHAYPTWAEDEEGLEGPSFARCVPAALLALLGTAFAAYRGFRLLQGDVPPSYAQPESSPLLLLGVEPDAATNLATPSMLVLCGLLALSFLGIFILRSFALALATATGAVVAGACGLALAVGELAGGLGGHEAAAFSGSFQLALSHPGEVASGGPYTIGLAFGLTLGLAALFAALGGSRAART